jgi:PBP1b-binding outer membrane lipoprotein LpoB
MLRRNYAMAVIGLLLLLAGCSDDNAPTTAPRSAGRAPALATTTTHTQHKALTARADFGDIDQFRLRGDGYFRLCSRADE